MSSAPLADLVDDCDVGEEMMMLGGGHGFPQGLVTLEVPHQDAQAVQVRMLRRDDFKNGLSNSTKISPRRNQHLSHVLFTCVALQSQVLDRQTRLGGYACVSKNKKELRRGRTKGHLNTDLREFLFIYMESTEIFSRNSHS